MKNLQLLGICLVMSLACVTASAQHTVPLNEPNTHKPKLFGNLPDRIPVQIDDLRALLGTEQGKDTNLKLGNTNNSLDRFEGRVISAADKYNNIRSVVIRSSNFNGATLSLSSSIQSDGTVKFTGRIISFQHGDLYELQNQNDQYVLVKKNFYDLINE
jgi:hypothetical protein